jgi:membrane-associated phospholipid phosphatase
VIKTLKENKAFIIPYAIVLSTVVCFMLIYGKADIHIYLNRFRHPAADWFFKYFTHTGDGLFAGLFTISLLFIKFRYALIAAISTTLTGLIVQFLKLVVFEDLCRPLMYFETVYTGSYELRLVNDAPPGLFYTFPSGHSATAFAIFFLLALISKKKIIKFLFFIVAGISAYSRVYLSWHFLGDIAMGSFIGVLITFFAYWIIKRSKRMWLDKSFI